MFALASHNPPPAPSKGEQARRLTQAPIRHRLPLWRGQGEECACSNANLSPASHRYCFMLCLVLLFLMSCTEVDVIHCPLGEGSGYLRIHPDQSTYTLPAMRYHFYNMDAPVPTQTYPCDGHGNFDGDLPTGIYRVIAINPDADNVTFSGMDSHHTATVTTRPAHSSRTAPSLPLWRGQGEDSSKEDYQLYTQPGKVYALNLGDFTVSDNDTLFFEPTPELLIRRIRIRFLLSEQLQPQITGIDGMIGGVYPSVRLFGYEPRFPDDSDIAGSAVNFHAVREESDWMTLLDVFGICNPDYGRVYTNVLDLTLSLSDGRQASARVDLTGQLSDIIDESGGTIPLTLSLELSVEAIGAGFSVGILPWDPNGGDDIDLY